jgi:RNA polymerase sigma-B factor
VSVVGQPAALLGSRDVHDLFVRYRRSRDPRDRDLLTERFLPLARFLARQYFAGAERDDLEQVASLALLKAIERYDPARGVAFTTFAVPTITGELKRYFRDYGWSVHVPRSLREFTARVERAFEELSTTLGRTPTTHELAEHCGVSPERVLEALSCRTAHRPDSLDSPRRFGVDESREWLVGSEDDGYDRVEYAADLAPALARLPDRLREIIQLRFGEDLVQREIATRLGISQMHVSRLLRVALEELRHECSAEAALRRRGSPSLG